ncbi:ABC transporter substrate-binding protein [Clostridium sp. Marseille-P299]|uniref:ABC transporter substrate-binding protein n=1 Tax=Clostridium sp. Marseille-P299 TaxID=1805477 RepID=UPI000835011D|nr:extracellular solute-binding protein [Clostridium sp. Marseille-P299]
MMKKLKKKVAITLVAALSMAMLTACGGKEVEKTNSNVTPTEAAAEATPTQEVTPTSEPEPEMDLGGMEITIGDWWSTGEATPPTTAQEEATQEYREMIQKKYNFKMTQIAVGDWDTYQEVLTTSIMAEDPAADVFIMAPNWIAQPLSNGLLYDLATLESFDFKESKWNPSVISTMTYGNSIYGMASGRAEPKLGVYWNKRLFEEAGLDPNLPYDLQASGDWTWEKFEELCKKLTIDNNNDGIMDSYAMVSFSVDFFRGAVTSNDARFIGKDAQGKFYNGTLEPNWVEAMQWAVGLIQKGYEMPVPSPDANWDWFISAFHDAKVAMQVGEQYRTGTWEDMTDDFGFVLFPKGPKSEGYAAYFSDNIAVIPSCYDKETAEKIAFAYNLWTNPTPGYEEDADSWKDYYYTRFRDERAVDETLAMMYDGAIINNDYLQFVYGTSFGDIAYDVYALGKTPAEKAEEISGTWEALLNDANK